MDVFKKLFRRHQSRNIREKLVLNGQRTAYSEQFSFSQVPIE